MKKEIIIVFIFILSITFISAQPPFQETTAISEGIQIETPIIEYHKTNQDFSFHIHAHNVSNGLLLKNDTTNCIIHIYRPIDGEHIVQEEMKFCNDNNIDFELDVDSGNFTEIGQYAVLFYCEVPGEIGGFFEYGFDVTKTGSFVNTGESLMYIWILIILVLLSILGVYLSIIIPYANIMDENSKEKVVIKITMTKYMKLIVMWITSGIILLFLTVLTGMINNYVQFVEVRELFTNIYIFIRILGYGMSVTIMIFLFLNFWKDILLNKELIKHGKAFVEENIRGS